MEWRPIETAPKDDPLILISDGERVSVGYWHEGWRVPNVSEWLACSEGWFDYNHAYFFQSSKEERGRGQEGHQPTHWMPLPTPPKV